MLASVRSARDLTGLFVALGYQPDHTPAEDGWEVIAQWHRYRILACDATSPQGAVRDAVHRMAGSARPVLLAAVGGGLLVIGAPPIGPPRSNRLLVVSCERPSPFAVRQLGALAPMGSANALGHALRISEHLASEQVGDRFYLALRDLLQRMTAYLGSRGCTADRTVAALLPLTRILFLYFIQEKGWLDGRRDYLRAALDGALARHRSFHRSVLHPLFFGTLNRPQRARSSRAAPGVIPYLNGGLFEPHPVERRLGPVVFPNSLWRDAFDRVFDRFRFCVREAHEVDAIAPDMLGRVFERVMDAPQRHATGTFYTPEPVVRDVVSATIATALATEGTLSHDAAFRLLRGHLPSGALVGIRHAVRALRILDPAVGSGAFLLGALECLTEATLALNMPRGGPSPPDARGRIRRRILRENLFGVDLNPIAVRLAELRLWLAVVSDDSTTDVTRVRPLPNLDGVVQQGDALRDPLGAARSLGLAWHRALESERRVCRARDAVFSARGHDRRATERALRAAELRCAGETVGAAVESARHALRDLASHARGKDLFGRRNRLSSAQTLRHTALKQRLADLRSAARQIRDGQVPFFAFEVRRPEVMSQGGFSVVVGNPPWVRAERLPAVVRSELARRFSWWRVDAGRGFKHQPDVAVAFLQRASELTAPGGAIGFLVPSKVATAGYGAAARASLVKESTLTYLHRVADKDAARFGAVTYPLAVVLRRSPPPREHRIHLGFHGSDTIPQRDLGAGPWILIPQKWRRAIQVLEGAGQPLSAIVRPALGVKTGADSVFVGTATTPIRGVRTVQLGGTERTFAAYLLRPAIRGRDIDPFRVTPARTIAWCYDDGGTPLKRLPPSARAHFDTHRATLEARSDYRGGPLWTVFRRRAAVPGNRVVWADIGRRPSAAVLEALDLENAVPLNSCYVACCQTRALALTISAVLNSTWARVLTRVIADEARGGYRRHNAQVIGRVPLPSHPARESSLSRASASAHAIRTGDLDEIDRLVADALGLARRLRDDVRALAGDLG